MTSETKSTTTKNSERECVIRSTFVMCVHTHKVRDAFTYVCCVYAELEKR